MALDPDKITEKYLGDDPGTLKAMLLAECARAERLAQIIKEMQRHRFARRAETVPEDQPLLGFEEVAPRHALANLSTPLRAS
jgi:transposase